MEIIISHKSALEYWRLHRNVRMSDFAKQRRKSPPLSLPYSALMRDLASLGLSHPISVLVGRKNAQWKSKVVRIRVHTGKTPDGCFVSIGDGVDVSAPSFCFFQMAGELPLVKLIELGYELCGSYALPVKSEYSPGQEYADKTTYGHQQLTSTKALKAFTTRMEGVKGQKKARRALRYIADGSASPMETILSMLLTLPHKLGGYGLPAPKLNKRIDPGKAARQRSGKTHYKCDLLWPKAGFAVEYDSDFYHSNTERIVRDSKKRLDLIARDITVITLTSEQLRSTTEFEALAKLLAGKLHRQFRYKNPQFLQARRELRKLLL